jgi:ribosomal protein S18 acetylase RimI-like enzyme
MTDSHPLDNPVRSALLGPHAHFAQAYRDVLRYPADVSPFVALPVESNASTWDDVAHFMGPGAIVPLAGVVGSPPADWEVVLDLPGVQLIDVSVVAAVDREAELLTAADVPEMLALVERTKPGPFLQRTIELGDYYGIRRNGKLIAMAGERMRVPGWTEISAVCTDGGWRGNGLATRLVLTVAAGIKARGDTPFLHAAATNTNAIRLYETLGFQLRTTTTFAAVQVPESAA